MGSGTPRRPWSWLEDTRRRGAIEASARRAMPLHYSRRRRGKSHVSVYKTTLEVPGYEPRNISIEFDHRYPSSPEIFADGPSGREASPHRYPNRNRTCLCVWYPGDPDSAKWTPDDGLLLLLGMVAEHLFKEAWWRETGEWLGQEYPHAELTKSDARTS